MLADVIFDLVQRGNPLECPFGAFRLVRMRREEVSATLNPTSSVGYANLLGITVIETFMWETGRRAADQPAAPVASGHSDARRGTLLS